eukprot:1372499-Heterocapsa_arctica.AAC.1
MMTAYKKEEDKMVTYKDFVKAINMLKEQNEDAVRENKEEAKMTRISLRDMGRAMTKRRKRSPMPDTGRRRQRARKEDTTK